MGSCWLIVGIEKRIYLFTHAPSCCEASEDHKQAMSDWSGFVATQFQPNTLSVTNRKSQNPPQCHQITWSMLAQTSFSSFRMKFTSVDTHRDCLLRCRNGHAVVNWKLDYSPRPLTPLLPIHKITDGSCCFVDRMGLLLRQYSQELICKEELQQLKESWQTTAKDGKQSWLLGWCQTHLVSFPFPGFYLCW